MEILRYSAFTTEPTGGNPAGVVLTADGTDAADMQRIAADVGYSETAFFTRVGERRFAVRYFSPKAEVPFCGHATIASAVAYADRHGDGQLLLDTAAGPIHVSTADGTATLVSVAPRVAPLDDLTPLLAALRWSPDDLDPALPPRVGYAGAWHPILAVRSRRRLSELDYDFDALATLMAQHDWTTVDLIWRDGDEFHARNPFPPGGVVEDPATGAAAAAFGGYLRALRLVDPPATVTIRQGEDLGRPSRLTVHIPAEPDSGIAVTGSAVPIE